MEGRIDEPTESPPVLNGVHRREAERPAADLFSIRVGEVNERKSRQMQRAGR